jgi:hypothetical protein
MLGLTLRIGVSNQRAGFAEAKSQLSEQPLTLPHPQGDSILLVDPGCERLTIPDLSRQLEILRTSPKGVSYLLKLLIVKLSWSPRPHPIDQASQALFFKAVYPILDSPRCIAQKMRRFTTAHALRDQEHPMQAVIVPGLPRAANFILQCEGHSRGVPDLEFSHAARVPGGADIRNYL